MDHDDAITSRAICIGQPQFEIPDYLLRNEMPPSPPYIHLDEFEHIILNQDLATLKHLRIYFFGDCTSHEIRAHRPDLSAASCFLALLQNTPELERLDIYGFSSYYQSIRYRTWDVHDSLFSDLPEAGVREAEEEETSLPLAPKLTHLAFNRCCFSNNDIRMLGSRLPHVHHVQMNCCSGHTRDAVEGYLLPYFELDYDNDDYWHPDDTNPKARDAHYNDGLSPHSAVYEYP